jgi:hypothetical protein
MKMIISIAGLSIIIAGLMIGVYYGNEAYQKHKYIHNCIEKMFSDNTDIAQQKAEAPIVREYCTCVYNQMEQNVSEGWAEFGCAFDILIRLAPESNEE